MQITILATGKCRDKAMLALEKEYHGRMASPWKVSVRELPEDENKEVEAKGQLAALASLGEVVKVVLDERGELLGSRELAGKFSGWRDGGRRGVAVVIGGANGVNEAVRKQADLVLGLGRLTYPHQLVRVMLAEQVYRVMTILNGHPYHRD